MFKYVTSFFGAAEEKENADPFLAMQE